jgi:carbamate kinase
VAERVLIALGGNALVRPGQAGTVPEQAENLRSGLAAVVEAARRGWHVLVTHGNGPQVGHLLLRAELARGTAYDVPLDVCVAQSQGETGCLMARVLNDLLAAARVERDIAVVLTQVLVSPDDPAFLEPDKPIGMDGRRRRVASPRPLRVVEREVLRRLYDAGTLVVAGGGGGIPVALSPRGGLAGVEAVVDKDFTSALLARDLDVDRLLILTNVDHVKLRLGRRDERPLLGLTAAEAKRYLREGHFQRGSMGPKVEAAIGFLEDGGREAVIAHLDEGLGALDGRAGTRIVPDEVPNHVEG